MNFETFLTEGQAQPFLEKLSQLALADPSLKLNIRIVGDLTSQSVRIAIADPNGRMFNLLREFESCKT